MAVEHISEPYRIVFPKLGIDITIDPTAFTIFGLRIQWYGIIIALGLLLAMLYCFPKMKRFGIDSDRALDAVIGGIIGGIIGARAYYVLLKWEDYKDNIKEIFNTRNGGLAIYGGLIGAILMGMLVCKIRKVKIPPMLDIAALGFLIGQGIGRWGNFVNQEAFGKNTNFFLGMSGGEIQKTIAREMAMGGEMLINGMNMNPTEAVHPCFLYESLWCILGFVFLAWYSKRRKFDGQIFLMYVAWYGLGRFFIEGLRTDSLMVGQIRASQALAAVLVLSSVSLLIMMLAMHKRKKFILYCNTDESKKILADAEKARERILNKDMDNETEDNTVSGDYEELIDTEEGNEDGESGTDN